MCARPAKLIKAHIIPEAFFRALRGGETEPPPVVVTPGEYPRRAPIGVYDSAILCGDCEPRFDQVDGYGARVLLQDFRSLFSPVPGPHRVGGYESAAVDARLLLRFLVATLWRASVSKDPFFGRVGLGRYEKVAERFALEDADDGGVFDAVLARWPDASEVGFLSHGIMDPHRSKFDGVNTYRMYLGETVAEIKVDARPFPRRLAELGLRLGAPVRVVMRDFANSKDLAAMRKTAQGALRPRGR